MLQLGLRARAFGQQLAWSLPIVLAGCCIGGLYLQEGLGWRYGGESYTQQSGGTVWAAGSLALLNPLAVPSPLCLGTPPISELQRPPAEPSAAETTQAVGDSWQPADSSSAQYSQSLAERYYQEGWQQALHTPLLELWRFPALIALQLLVIAYFAGLATRAIELRRLNE